MLLGTLTRADLDRISTARPIIDFLAGLPEAARQQANLAEGHVREGGMFGVMPKLLPAIAAPGRLRGGPECVMGHDHAIGVTLRCEPGGLLSKPWQDARRAVLSRPRQPLALLLQPGRPVHRRGRARFPLDIGARLLVSSGSPARQQPSGAGHIHEPIRGVIRWLPPND
jgi:hypothetical protein